TLKLKMFWQGLNNQITLAVVPVLAALADKTDGWANKLFDSLKMSSWSAAFVDGAEWVARAGARLMDIFPPFWEKVVDGAKAARNAFVNFGVDLLTQMDAVIKSMTRLGVFLSNPRENLSKF